MNYYAKKQENTTALIYARKMLIEALKNNNEGQEAESYYNIAQFQRKLNVKDSAFYYYNKSKKLFLQRKDSLQLGKTLFQLSIIESDFGSYAESDSLAVLTLKYLNGRNVNYIAATYNCLGINSKKQFLYDDAISYYEAAIKISKNKTGINIYKNNIANVYKELKNYPKAILIFEDLLKETEIYKRTKARVLDNLAHIKMLNNSKENFLQDFLQAASIREKENDYFGLIASYGNLSDYFKEKDKVKSLFYAIKMYEMAKKEMALNGLLEAIDKVVILQTPQKAIKYYKESIFLRDSLQIVETKRQYKFAKIKYNYEEEEKQKLKFKTLAAESKLIALEENNQKKNLLILGIVFIAVLLFIVYRRKQQHKKRILQEKYNTETRIAKRLHDELGNDIYNAITKVLNPKFKIEEIVNDLDKIYLQTRSISHENDSIETGENFEAYFRALVANYNSDECKIMLKDLASINLSKLNKEKQIVVYRVFNELFVNMKKHSKASLVVLSCKKTNNTIEMKYIDNGVGFKENAIILKNGLQNMETRIKSINGTINFENKSDKGLQVTFNFKK
ncbi:tetratricopeptide repeat-containing sensor histidine kinase [Polaribacter glomeratus]|nr:tetratricopeptide repeat-containing sensor histidine kinase [Polaribacter glomeratus]